MDINGIIQEITKFTQDNIIASVIVGLFILFLLLRHPKVLLTVVVLIFVGYGLAELFDVLRVKARI